MPPIIGHPVTGLCDPGHTENDSHTMFNKRLQLSCKVMNITEFFLRLAVC